MKTRVWKVSAVKPEQDMITQAALLLKQGQIVAFPTETVYGLGACVYSQQGIDRIYQAKNRAQQNPLLIHISSIEQAISVTGGLLDHAQQLIRAFWPGPLSIILSSERQLPSAVKNNGQTIGLRMPSHPVALALISQSGPLAATSANLSGRPSPIYAQDVLDDLDGKIAAIVDAGPAISKIESTIVDLSAQPYKIIRLGAISLQALNQVLPDSFFLEKSEKHYHVHAQVEISKEADHLIERVRTLLDREQKVAVVKNDLNVLHMPADLIEHTDYVEYQLSFTEESLDLYTVLRKAELTGAKFILFAPLPGDDGKGTYSAILERISRCVL